MSPDFAVALPIGVSVLLHGVATHVSFGRRGQLVGQVGRFVYYVGLPYLALREGMGQARMMGLSGWNGVGDASISVALGVAAFAVLALAWHGYARAVRDLPAVAATRLPATADAHWTETILQAMYLEVHWAFYRSGFILWLGGDYYSGSCLGFLAVIFESLLSPAVRAALRRRDAASMEILALWSLALCMTVGFFFSRNLWLMVSVHCLVAIGLLQIRTTLGLPVVEEAQTR